MRSLNNFRAEQPHQHAMYYLRLLMTEVAWTKDELRDALDGEILSSKAMFLLYMNEVLIMWLFHRCDAASTQGVHSSAVVTVTHWSPAARQHHQTGWFDKPSFRRLRPRWMFNSNDRVSVVFSLLWAWFRCWRTLLLSTLTLSPSYRVSWFATGKCRFLMVCTYAIPYATSQHSLGLLCWTVCIHSVTNFRCSVVNANSTFAHFTHSISKYHTVVYVWNASVLILSVCHVLYGKRSSDIIGMKRIVIRNGTRHL